jgi:response regulator NasT
MVPSDSTVNPASTQPEKTTTRLVKPSTVLVADDEHLIASGIAANLTACGYHVVGPAADGAEAIRLCELLQPDLALLDIRMPRVTGLEATSRIYGDLGIPVVILSAFSDPDYVAEANRAGVFGYILKPITQDQLKVAIPVAWGRFVEHMQSKGEASALRTRLEDRKIIEQAKWVIVKRKGMDEPDAMRLLQKQARNNRRALVEVARSVLENGSLFS